jgi:subtilisin family serine protease
MADLEVIVKYNGGITGLGYQTEILDNNYAILTLPEEDVPALNSLAQIEYAERSKIVALSEIAGQARNDNLAVIAGLTRNLRPLSNAVLATGIAADRSCIPNVQNERLGFGLSGEGVLVAIIDSGIDYRHPDFINPDGTSRMVCIWDQTLQGAPPEGFLYGTEFSNAQINSALAGGADVPHKDYAGHGTAVAGIAAGTAMASEGAELGVAPRASIIAVKLGERDDARFARSTEIMRALKYVYDKAVQLNMPLAVNLSYGTNDGSHDGKSLFETFIDSMAERWRSVIVVASGNEGAARHHFQYTLKQDESVDVIFTVGNDLERLTVELWKHFADTFTCELIAPNGVTTGVLKHTAIPTLVHLDGVRLSFNYIQPSHYNQDNALALRLMAEQGRLIQGAWTLRVVGSQVVVGAFDVWLPTLEETMDKTMFLLPSTDTTLTLPSTTDKVITVGGYDPATGGVSAFSGRGYTRTGTLIKPDLVAPAVNIRGSRAGGGYDQFTGTSMAAPFVTGSAALMMQWGIIQGNDKNLFGQRVKAFLIKGAKRERASTDPNNIDGYGALCLEASMEYLKEFTRIK